MFIGVTSDPMSSFPTPAESEFEFIGNLVTDNVCAEGTGGGILVSQFAQGDAISTGRLALNTVANNSSLLGAGGVELRFASLFDSTGVYAGFNRFILDNSIVATNSGFGLGGQVPLSTNYDLQVQYSDVVGNVTADYESWIGDRTGVAQNISSPPLFVDASVENYRLQAESPAIDAGDPGIAGAPAIDIDGQERIVDGDDDGISVIDMGAYEFSVSTNFPPVALIALLNPVECDSPAGASVTLDGSGSSDPDSTPGTNDDIVSFEWFEDFGTGSQEFLGAGETLLVTRPLGDHAITLLVTDSFGETDTDEVILTIEDTTPPSITVDVTPDNLWPPNHRMVNITATVIATDACGTPSVELTSVISNEVDNGVGDGNTTDDIQDAGLGTPDFDFKLRAERASGGDGRVYTVTYTTTDGEGNTTSADSLVTVDHDRGGVTEPVILSVEETAGGTLLTWTDVSSALAYNVIRGDLADLVDKENLYETQTVSCIESGSTDTSTSGHEDALVPVPGQVFFYLAEYGEGEWSSYGTESAAKPRAARVGDCR